MLAIKFNSGVLRAKKKEVNRLITLEMTKLLKEIVRVMHETVHERTPVWEGTAVANFQWSQSQPFYGKIDAVESGPTGKTSKMPVGAEPRRSANQALSDASIDNIDFSKPFRKLFLTNNAEHFELLEAGAAPTPESSRVNSATGIMRAADAEVLRRLEGRPGNFIRIVRTEY